MIIVFLAMIATIIGVVPGFVKLARETSELKKKIKRAESIRYGHAF